MIAINNKNSRGHSRRDARTHSGLGATSSDLSGARWGNALASDDPLKKLSDKTLLERLAKLRGAERSVLVRILQYLNEVERRRLYVPWGYATLYEFCTDYLRYSRSAAMRRIHAARCIEKCPRVIGMLRSGAVTLTAVAMISRILTRENSEEILNSIKNKSTREVEMLVSRHRPDFMLRDRVRPVCLMVPEDNSAAASGDVINNDSLRIPGAGKISSQYIGNTSDKDRDMNTITLPDRPTTAIQDESLTGTVGSNAGGGHGPRGCGTKPEEIERVRITQKFRLEFTVGPEFMEKLAKIRSLLSTKYPKGIDFQTLFDLLLTEYLERHSPEERIKRRDTRKKSKKGSSEKIEKESVCMNRRIRNQDTKERSRYIPQDIKDKIFERDGGRCTYRGPGGKRCDSRWNLHVDHIIPFAGGGDNSPENLRLLCAKHNNLEAEREFGRDFILSRIRKHHAGKD